MSSDQESRRRVGLPPEGDRRTPRSLGRGFEDIAGVFLSRKTADASGDGPATVRSDDTSHEPQSRVGTVLLRPATGVSKEQVIGTVREFSAAVEGGLRVIDADLPCGAAGSLDLLAVDRTSRLVVIDVAVQGDDGVLLRAVAQADWIARNTASVRRMYAGQVIDFVRPPRVYLVAPRFSPILTAAARHMTLADITCVTYRGVDVSGRLGMFFERTDADGE